MDILIGKPKISILLPVFNNCSDITSAIDSINKQTFKNWELIIIDDCSTDETMAKINEYLRESSDMMMQTIIIRNSINLGTYISLNKGLSQANGEYICRIDSDDNWDSTLLEKHCRILDNDVKKKYIGVQSLVKKDNGELLFGEITLMYRKKIISQIGYYDSVRYGADTEFYYRILAVYGYNKIVRLHEPLYFYHHRVNSLTSSPTTGFHNPSSGRDYYFKSFTDWHLRAIKEFQNKARRRDIRHRLYISYPLIHRPFPIDNKMAP